MAGELRRSTAAQFFFEEDTAALESTSTYDRVVELLNQASLLQRDSQKVNNLKQVQELIVHKEPNLLDNFLDEMIAFQTDRSVDVKKFVISFMEEACKKEPELLTKILPCMQILFQDENVNIKKKVILTMIQIYKVTFLWLSKTKSPTTERTVVWELMQSMKASVFDMIDSENDGIRTHVVKLLEGIVLVLSWKTPDSEVPKNVKPEQDVTLDIVSEVNPYLRIRKLEEEGKKTFEVMLQFQASPHISSINLMTVMGSITNLAKQRPIFFGKAVQAFEALHVNLPPTLAKSQVSSVRKNLKMQMLALLKHQSSVDYLTQITTLLTDLGATQAEVMKSMPKVEDGRKRKAEDTSQPTKKAKVEVEADMDVDDEEIGMTPWAKGDEKIASAKLRQSAIDITAEDLVPRLQAQNVADLVLISMVMLPDTMPAHFEATYTPISAAGTEGQIKHMARLLATQLTMAGMGKGVAEIQRQTVEEGEVATPAATPLLYDMGTSPKQLIQTVVGGYTNLYDLPSGSKTEPSMAMQPPSQPVRRGIKQFKLSNVTRPLERDLLDQLSITTLQRILDAERPAALGNSLQARNKILCCLVSMFGGELKNLLQEYIFDDLRTHSELAFSWLYQEYANCQAFSSASLSGEKSTLGSYDECLTRLLNGLLERPDQKEGLFHRLLLEAPCVTDNAIQMLKKFCTDETRIASGFNTLRDLILTRPVHRLRFLDVLLDFTSHDKPEVRNTAIRITKKLYERAQLKQPVEHYALVMLKFMLHPTPPGELYAHVRGKPDPPPVWTEDATKMCLYLYLGLLPVNHKLIHELAQVYTSTAADIKRTILRVLENPVKGVGMHSPELLTFVENCPKGAETLVTRVIHILTDKAAPSPDLVERVRDLYHKRVPDVRFLIPVLAGLSKKEVIGALPKLIKLNPVVVKEVFNRLLGGHGEATYTSPLTPAELLVALHNVDTAKCDMKTIIKATNLCFAEKNIYTQEVLAVVMQQLMEQNPLPTLLMRTVLQSLSMYPRLIGFVMNILQRLITKQVWKQKKVWEGFIKCCQRTKPQSFLVLLQLPAPQLRNIFDVSPDLREPLLNHVNSFTPHQRAHIPKAIISVLERDMEEEKRQAELKLKVEREKKEAEEKAKKQEEERLLKLEEEKVRQQKAEEERKQKIEAEKIKQQKLEEDRKLRLEADKLKQQKLEEDRKVKLEADKLKQQKLEEEQQRKLEEGKVQKQKMEEERLLKLKEQKLQQQIKMEEEKRRKLEEQKAQKLEEERAALKRAAMATDVEMKAGADDSDEPMETSMLETAAMETSVMESQSEEGELIEENEPPAEPVIQEPKAPQGKKSRGRQKTSPSSTAAPPTRRSSRTKK